MKDNNEVTNGLRALAEASPREARQFVQQRLLENFRARRDRIRRVQLGTVGACCVLVLALCAWLRHIPEVKSHNVSPSGEQASGFITLPYGQSGVPLEQPVIVRLNIPVSELDRMGVPFAPAGAKNQVRADLLIGQDGVARAVRFVE
jgi:hypothetical protein